eukprot:7845048-Alexandrium_andersonii.AAC.1
MAVEPEAVPRERARPDRDQGGLGSSGGDGNAGDARRTWPPEPGGAARAGGEDEPVSGQGSAE